jgi:hypothetical protein
MLNPWGEARAIKYNRLNKKNTSLIPPDDDSLTFHSARTNYIAWIFKMFSLPDPPKPPFDHGWVMDDHGAIVAMKHSKPPLPADLNEITNQIKSFNENSDSNESGDEE